MHKHPIVLVCLVLATLAMACSSPSDSAALPSPPRPRRVKPNVVLVVLDDVGFGQLSPYGGLVRTPNIARLAKSGLLYTSYHSAGGSSSSRAALLTGRAPRAEGSTPTPIERTTLASRLRALGYSTYAVGKWHNTPAEHVTPHGPFDTWPQSLGFEHFYGFVGAEVDQWAPPLWHDDWPIDPAAGHPDYSLARDLFDHAIRFVREKDATGEPFFLYLAPGTTHAPHHAPRDVIERNRGRFDDGWDRMREATLARQKRLGIVPAETELPPRPDAIPAWSSLRDDERRLFTRMQEVHAAAAEHVDTQLGRLLDELEDAAMRDNTIVIVTSDEGASGSGGLLGTANMLRRANGLPDRLDVDALDELGGPKTYGDYPAGWALADNTPGRYWSGAAHEGGLRTPLVISWPKGIAARGELRSQLVHAVDIAPTVLELVRGRPLPGARSRAAVDGRSFAATLASASATAPRELAIFETYDGRAIVAGDWKAVAFDDRWPWSASPPARPERWELYDLANDPGEAHDLARAFPEKLAELRSILARASPGMSALTRTAEARAPQRTLLYEGITRAIPEVLSAPVQGRSHSITAHVRVTSDAEPDGVLATCGGRFGGYALYVSHGKLTYVHNYVGDARYVVESTAPIHPGERELRLRFEKTGPDTAHVRLFVDGVLGGEGDVAHVVPRVFSTSEPCDIGGDSGTAAGDYDVPSLFSGRVHDLTISVDDDASTHE